jgi:hypothetical protein
LKAAELISAKKFNRKLILPTIINLVKLARTIDRATEDWTQANAEAWINFRTEVEAWLANAPKVPKRVVEKSKSAA